MIASSVTHISDEFEPNKVVCYGQIGTYIRAHVLFITNYVKYVFQREYIAKLITHFPVLFNYVKIMKHHYL